MADSLIPISDEQAKLGQEALRTLRGAGSFIEKALGGVPEDLIGYLGGDWLRARRAENIARLFAETMERLRARGIDEPKAASLSVALPIIRGGADEDRAELIDLWARLLASAMDPKLNGVRYAFIDAVKRMDPPDAILLRHLYKNGIDTIQLGNNGPSGRGSSVGHIADETSLRPESVEVSLVTLELVGMCWKRDTDNSRYVTAMFSEFMRACYPEVKP